jgi:hypothetical protein
LRTSFSSRSAAFGIESALAAIPKYVLDEVRTFIVGGAWHSSAGTRPSHGRKP